LFAIINGWITSCLFLRETYSIFHCQEHSSFTLFVQRVFSFSSTAFFISKSCFKKVDWCWKSEKSFMLIVVQMGACLDRGLDFCMSCLMLF
jgi:hypothetical protein